MRRIQKWICLWVCLLLLAGCGRNTDPDGERSPLDFTVVEAGKIPKQLQEALEKHREEEMQIVFQDKDDLYAVRGYGRQESGGYSIAVDEVSEGEEKIHIATTLIGPSQTEKISKDPSFPVIVIKLQNRDKEIVFE